MKDNSVIFLKDWKPLVFSLSIENQQVFWELFTSYEFGAEQECDNECVKPIWNFIKSQLDNMKEKYQTIIERNKINGAKGGRPKSIKTEENPQNPMGYLESEKTPKDKDNEKDNVINTDIVPNTIEDQKLLDIDDAGEFEPLHFLIAKSFHNLFLKYKGQTKTLKNASAKQYVDTIRLMLERDGVTLNQLVSIRLYLEAGFKKEKGVDTFWSDTIFSVSALRNRRGDVYTFDRIGQRVKQWLSQDGNTEKVMAAVEHLNKKVEQSKQMV